MKTYTGETVLPEGVLNVKVKYQEQCHDLKLYIVKGVGPPLFGRQWLHYIKLDWKNIITQKSTSELHTVQTVCSYVRISGCI